MESNEARSKQLEALRRAQRRRDPDARRVQEAADKCREAGEARAARRPSGLAPLMAHPVSHWRAGPEPTAAILPNGAAGRAVEVPREAEPESFDCQLLRALDPRDGASIERFPVLARLLDAPGGLEAAAARLADLARLLGEPGGIEVAHERLTALAQFLKEPAGKRKDEKRKRLTEWRLRDERRNGKKPASLEALGLEPGLLRLLLRAISRPDGPKREEDNPFVVWEAMARAFESSGGAADRWWRHFWPELARTHRADAQRARRAREADPDPGLTWVRTDVVAVEYKDKHNADSTPAPSRERPVDTLRALRANPATAAPTTARMRVGPPRELHALLAFDRLVAEADSAVLRRLLREAKGLTEREVDVLLAVEVDTETQPVAAERLGMPLRTLERVLAEARQKLAAA